MKIEPFLSSFLAFSIAAFTFILITHLGIKLFGGFDYSVVADIGYRLHLGQKIYEDFQTSTPIWFNLGAQYAFDFFGVKASSLVLMFAIYSSALCLWIFLLLRLLTPTHQAVLGTLVIASGTAITVSYWWYNPIATLAVAAHLLSVMVLSRAMSSPSLKLLASFGFSAVLVAGMKPNLAGPALVASFTIVLIQGHLRIAGLTTLVLAGATTLGTIFAYGISPFEIITSYLEVSSRAWPSFERFEQYTPGFLTNIFKLMTLGLIWAFFLKLDWLAKQSPRDLVQKVFFAILLFAQLSAFKQNEALAFAATSISLLFFRTILSLVETRSRLFGWLAFLVWMGLIATSFNPVLKQNFGPISLLAIAIALPFSGWVLLDRHQRNLAQVAVFTIGLMALFTNGEPKIVDLPLMALGALAISNRNANSKSHQTWINSFLFLILIPILLMGLHLGSTRYRAQVIGWPNQVGNQDSQSLTDLEISYFEGTSGSPTLYGTLKEMKTFLTNFRLSADSRVFFGNRLQFFYPVFGIQPLRNHPVWYHPGVSLSDSSLIAWNQQFEKDPPHWVIFPRGDRTYFPQDLEIFILRNYDYYQGQYLDFFQLRSASMP